MIHVTFWTDSINFLKSKMYYTISGRGRWAAWPKQDIRKNFDSLLIALTVSILTRFSRWHNHSPHVVRCVQSLGGLFIFG